MPWNTVLTCPECGREQAATIPDDACVIAYECTGCNATLRPLEGDCCVFCSYAVDPCPSSP